MIGGGVAATGGAAAVDHGVTVTIFDAGARLGGKCTGVTVPMADGRGCDVDLGVSDFNAETFVRVRGLLDALGVAYAPICQDAAFVDPGGCAALWTREGHAHAESAAAAGLGDEIARFGRAAVAMLDDPACADWDLQRFLHAHGFAPAFAAAYVHPRAIGCFAMPGGDPGRFPASSLLRFWRGHGLVGRSDPPPRMAVVGGMHRYCDALQRWLAARGAEIRCGTAVTEIVAHRDGIAVACDDVGPARRFDHVVVAAPPHALARVRLRGAGLDVLAAFVRLPSQRARVVAHTDAGFMPRARERWGAYNYVVGARAAAPTLTFYPKRLRGLPDDAPDVFVTMNPHRPIDPCRVIAERMFDHPLACSAARGLAAQIDRLQGRGNLWACGSHLREPFLHEQALASGEDVADRLVQGGRRQPRRTRPSPSRTSPVPAASSATKPCESAGEACRELGPIAPGPTTFCSP
ncbi:MAG: FAD-dependent oxidoreductase [Nannocystaceae bacterium]